jgi:hypothetical protein
MHEGQHGLVVCLLACLEISGEVLVEGIGHLAIDR